MKRRTILLVEDNPLLLDMTAEMLDDLGFHVVGVTQPEEALARFAGEPQVDAILLNNSLPGMSGTDLLARLRAQRDVPALFISGVRSDLSEIRGVAALRKPFSLEKLRDALSELLDQTSN